MAATAIRDGIRSVMYQLQRIDAFLLDTLYLNVQRMHERVPPASTSHARFQVRSDDQQKELPSWTMDGFKNWEFHDVDIVALQLAPWTFVTSFYAYSLIFMAIILNRIQHVVAPAQSHRARTLQSWCSWLFPIDASATPTRFIMRSVSLYLLWKSALRMTVIVFQAFDAFPAMRILEPLGRWASASSMIDVCRSSFVAVCSGMVVSSFTRGLDGSHPPISSFNLPQYAFLLHLYSSPLGTVFNRILGAQNGQNPALRPNRHVLMTMLLPLLQITLLHTQGIWKRYSRDVLIPTAICSTLGLTHFVYTLWAGHIANYPLLQVLPSFLELFFVFMIACTTSINVLSQILQYGRIARPLFSPGAGAFPSKDEEFCLALVRLGTSSLDATSVAGLGNEVAPIPSNSKKGGTVRLGPSGVLQMEIFDQKKSRSRSRKAYANNPFAREIKHVRAVSAEGDLWINVTWMKELYRFAVTLWRFIKAMWIAIRARGRAESTSEQEGDSSALEETNEENKPVDKHRNAYTRFLAGDVISDDEGSDYDGHEDDSLSNSDTESTKDAYMDHTRTATPESDEWAELETSQLYSEHGSQRATTPLAPVLLAHLTAQSGSPLTRRKYSSMLRGDDRQSSDIAQSTSFDPAAGSRHSVRLDPEEEEASVTRRMCVICLCSERTVICWPCRCLSMCEDCRSNLASRNGPSKHSCPCCRQPVEGFSRIFIP